MQDNLAHPLAYLLGVLLTSLYMLHYYLRRQFHQRISLLRKRTPPDIPGDKVIVAIEPKDLLFRVKQSAAPDYQELKVNRGGIDHFWTVLQRLFGRGVFFKNAEPRRSLSAFLHSLSQHPRVQLALYTCLPLSQAESMLRSADLLHYFPEDMRQSSASVGSAGMKHPIEVDFETRRVVILTGSCSDHLEEDSPYFLAAGRQPLSKVARLLEKLITKNRDIDELHNELALAKLRLEALSAS